MRGSALQRVTISAAAGMDDCQMVKLGSTAGSACLKPDDGCTVCAAFLSADSHSFCSSLDLEAAERGNSPLMMTMVVNRVEVRPIRYPLRTPVSGAVSQQRMRWERDVSKAASDAKSEISPLHGNESASVTKTPD